MNILDFGGQTGKFKYLIESYMLKATVKVLDKSPMSKDVIAYEFKNGENELPFKNNTFDAVTCLSVVQYIPNLKALFDEFSRVLKPGGHLCITYPVVWNPFNKHGKTQWYCNMALWNNGFSVVERAKLGGWSYYYLDCVKNINHACQKWQI